MFEGLIDAELIFFKIELIVRLNQIIKTDLKGIILDKTRLDDDERIYGGAQQRILRHAA